METTRTCSVNGCENHASMILNVSDLLHFSASRPLADPAADLCTACHAQLMGGEKRLLPTIDGEPGKRYDLVDRG